MFNLNIIFANIYKKAHVAWASLKNDSTFGAFVVFASFIFIKLFYFQFSIEPLTRPQSFSLFFLPKIAISFFLPSFLFVTKKKWWTIPLSFAIDIWAIGNIIYYRASGFFINADALQMIDNMRGFWDSILIYFSWGELIPILTTLIYSFFILKSNSLKTKQKNFHFFFLITLLCIFMKLFINYFHHSAIIKDYWVRNKNSIENVWNLIRPIIDIQYDSYYAARLYFNHGIYDWDKKYILQNTIVDYLFANISFFAYKKYYTNKLQELKFQAPISSADTKIISNLTNHPTSNQPNSSSPPKTNLVIILFESLEGWVFEDFAGSKHIAQNMKKLINKNHSLFVPRVRSQVKQGNSGDGQMIVLTGILPLQVGAACRLYGSNSYPNYAHFFNKSTTINPSPGSWNQGEVNSNYGINHLVEFYGNDNQMIDSLIAQGNNAKHPFFLLGITTASHSPFNCDESYTPPLLNDPPTTLKNYLTCVNYTDQVIGKLISKIESDTNWTNTTLVIVGDHTVFKEQMLDKFHHYAEKANISLKTRKNYIPLIIYSPSITSKKIENEIFNQADIYSTILTLIGKDDYYWKGVGKSILSDDISNLIDEETGYRISDIIIRNNYFEKYAKLNKTAPK